jgi:hypothetical protein
MAIRKKYNIKNSLPLQLKLKRNLLKENQCPNYSVLFETLSKKDFMNYMFHKPYFAIQFAREWRQDYPLKVRQLNSLFGYMDSYDIYEYIRINHSLYKGVDRIAYTGALFRLFTDLFSQVPSDKFESLVAFDSYSNPEYVFGYSMIKGTDKSLINIAREVLYYGRTFKSLKNGGINNTELMAKLYRIYQLGFFPINISEETFLF